MLGLLTKAINITLDFKLNHKVLFTCSLRVLNDINVTASKRKQLPLAFAIFIRDLTKAMCMIFNVGRKDISRDCVS